MGILLDAPARLASFTGALIGSLILGFLLRRRDIDVNAALGSLFALMLGVAFLAIGLSPGAKSQALGLLWGSLLFVSPAHVAALAAVLAVLAASLWLLERPLRAILFDRQLAAMLVGEGTIFTGLLVVAAAVIAVNLETVGGLLLYSLIANPAVAAIRLARSFRAAVAWSAVLGSGSAVAGFLAAYLLDFPVGACIVLVSSAVVAVAMVVRRAPASVSP